MAETAGRDLAAHVEPPPKQAFSGPFIDNVKWFRISAGATCKRSYASTPRIDWDHLGSFRPFDVPFLFPRFVGSQTVQAQIPSGSKPQLDSCREGPTVPNQEQVLTSEQAQASLNGDQANTIGSGRPVGRPRVPVNRDKAMRLRQQGLSWREIAGKLGAGTTTVRRACNAAMPCQNPQEERQ